MKKLDLTKQQEITGGSSSSAAIMVVIGVALYKVFMSAAGRISIGGLLSFNWR